MSADNMTDYLHTTEQAVIPTWVEKEDEGERIDLALLVALGAVCLSLAVLLWLCISQCCCTGSGRAGREEAADEDFELLGSVDEKSADDQAQGEDDEEDEEEEEEEYDDDDDDDEETAALNRYSHANGASTPEPVLRLEPESAEVPSLPPPVVGGDAEDPRPVTARSPARSPARPSPAVPAATLEQLRAAMLAEETWRHRAESAENGELIDSPRATELAETSLGDADQPTTLSEVAMKLLSAELSAENYRRRAEDAERALRPR
jgi:hypothetical protein